MPLPLFVVSLSVAATAEPAEAKTLAVIVNKSNATRSISKAKLRSIFLRERQRWSDGESVAPINRPPSDVQRQLFDRVILGMSREQVDTYWVDQSVRGVATKPQQISSASLAKRLVRTTAGAIAYVGLGDVDDSVRVLKIDGLAPSDAGYALSSDRGRAAPKVSYREQAQLLSKALAYERNLVAPASGPVVIAVVHRRGDANSEADGRSVEQSFSRERTQVLGRPLKVLGLPYSSAEELATALKERGVTALYVTRGLDSALGALKKICSANRVIAVGANAEMVRRGLSLGVYSEKGRPKLIINLAAAKSNGAAFSSQLLRVAQVVGR